MPFRALLIGNGQIVDSLDMGGLADVLDGGDEALGTGVEKMFGLGAAIGFAPLSGFEVFVLGEAGSFTEGDEPNREARVGDAVEDAIELTAIMLPYGKGTRVRVGTYVSHEVCFSGLVSDGGAKTKT